VSGIVALLNAFLVPVRHFREATLLRIPALDLQSASTYTTRIGLRRSDCHDIKRNQCAIARRDMSKFARTSKPGIQTFTTM
jgi:hypothetical protein